MPFPHFRPLRRPSYHSILYMEKVTTCVRPEWFVLSTYAGNELAKKRQLEEKGGLECFVPRLRVRRRDSSGRFRYQLKVALSNYVFVQATRQGLDRLRAAHPWVFEDLHVVRREKSSEGCTRLVPLVVPREQMESFIAVAGNEEEHVRFLDPREVDLRAGERVRVLGGPFAGVVGTYLRLGRRHARQVVVRIEGISAVATTALPAVLVERIDD